MRMAWLGLATLAISVSALAYTPPVDRAGPLTVRIEADKEFVKREMPQPVQVVLENSGEAALEGQLAIRLVDDWRVTPAEPVKFSVAAKAKQTLAFHVAAGPKSYGGVKYPIHAVATFTAAGVEQRAHPILIVDTKFPPVDREQPPAAWKPIAVGPNQSLGLWMLPQRRALVLVNGEKPLVQPFGWLGVEPRSHAHCEVHSNKFHGETHDGISMHPPYADRHVGSLAMEYPIQLPKTDSIRLTFAAAAGAGGKGDGVTFRVRVAPFDAPPGALGKVAFERHVKPADVWPKCDANLTEFAGQAVRIQLEAHPGPKNDTSFDLCHWAEPTLIAASKNSAVAGATAEPIELGAIELGGAKHRVRVVPGARGLLDAAVEFEGPSGKLSFRGFEVRVLGSWVNDPRSVFAVAEVKKESAPQGVQMRHRLSGPEESFDLIGRIWTEGGAIRASWKLDNKPADRPWRVCRVEETALGAWNRPVETVYAGDGNVIRKPEAFQLNFDGHRLATSFAGVEFGEGALAAVVGTDLPPGRLDVRPADRVFTLRPADEAVLTVIPCASVWDGVKTWRQINGLHAAGGVRKAAGRFVFDLWGGKYAATEESLRKAFLYGMTDAMVIWHNWQRWGYDYRLPEIYPPNPKLGTLKEMQSLARACREAGVLFAPHDNYIDFYPDAEGFSYDQCIAFSQTGRPVRAWFNEGRDALSYRYRADQIARFLQPNIELIRKNLDATGYFIDVWSSAGPYDYWTYDGKYFDRIYTRQVWGEQFAWIRKQLGNDAPQISESGHDQLIGWLDGAQTNHLRVGKSGGGKRGWCVWDIPCADAERTPWFDAAHHDRFILHGAGYPGRYEGGLDPKNHGIYSDDYMATEVLTGHPAMVSQPFNADVVRKYWLLHDLGRLLANQTIERVEYVDGDIHRQKVTWKYAGIVWINRGDKDWTVENVVLPPYGFLAKATTDRWGAEVKIERRDNLVVESARSANEVYVNARRPAAGSLPLRVSIESATPTTGRQFELALNWQAEESVPAGYFPFFHFVDLTAQETEREGIAFQGSLASGGMNKGEPGKWSNKVRGALPDDAKPGQAFELRFGFYRRDGGDRLALDGPNDGHHRVRLGTVQLENGRPEWKPLAAAVDPFADRVNTARHPVDFGWITTDGGCRASRSGKGILIVPLPQRAGQKFEAKVRWERLPWKLAEPAKIAWLDFNKKAIKTEPLRRQDERIVIECPADAFGILLE